VTTSLAALDGDPTGRPLGYLILSDTVFLLLAWGTYEHLVGE